jgi:DNA invertase Pin-like site-specific DNA recombinase
VASTRAGIYRRVSTDAQSVENQRAPLEALAAAREFELVATWEDKASGRHVRRVGLAQLIAAARRRDVDVVMVWSLDRLGRSLGSTLALVLELDALGVRVLSVREPWLDAVGPTRSLLVAVFAWVAELEREQIVARTKAGMERAKSRGKHIGRPRVYMNMPDILFRHDAGQSVRSISVALKIKRSTLSRALRAALAARAETGSRSS